MTTTCQGTFTVVNEKGLHMRPSTQLMKCAVQFKSRVSLRCKDNSVNAKSLLGILTLTATCGTKVIVEAEGDDAEQAVKAIVELAKQRFNISY